MSQENTGDLGAVVRTEGTSEWQDRQQDQMKRVKFLLRAINAKLTDQPDAKAEITALIESGLVEQSQVDTLRAAINDEIPY